MMRQYRMGSHTKTDLKVHLIWIPKYRKRILTGQVAIRTRELIRQVCAELEVHIISGKIASDHVHIFISYRPNQSISNIMQRIKGISSRILLQEFPHLRKQFWGKHFWARGYCGISSGNITDEVILAYIEDQEGSAIEDESRFQIDPI